MPGAIHRARQVADIPMNSSSAIANCFRMEACLELILVSQCKSLFSTPDFND
jgi:hypothetical protein